MHVWILQKRNTRFQTFFFHQIDEVISLFSERISGAWGEEGAYHLVLTVHQATTVYNTIVFFCSLYTKLHVIGSLPAFQYSCATCQESGVRGDFSRLLIGCFRKKSLNYSMACPDYISTICTWGRRGDSCTAHQRLVPNTSKALKTILLV